MNRFSKSILAATMLIGFAGGANAATIYFTDAAGNVGAYDTVTSTQSNVGSLAGFSVSQVVGLAYDGATNNLYVLDRSASKVYSMNATTGAAALAFGAGGVVFQGGAVKGSTLFGVNENTQLLTAFTLGGSSIALSGQNIDHTHGLGIDAASGQLYAARGGDVYAISDTGTLGALAFSQANFIEDVDYLAGNFVYVTFGNQIFSSGGSFTGASITGFGSLSGVAVRQGAAAPAVPEPATWGMMLVGFGIVGATVRRRSRSATAIA